MPSYDFACTNCAHKETLWMPFSIYKENNGIFECPQCSSDMRRVWSGKDNAPGIKTVERIEDRWKKLGIKDPEDPDYARINKQRIKYMREKNQKKLEQMIDEGKAIIKKQAKVGGKKEKFTKKDFDKLPDVAKSKIKIDKDKGVTEE